MTLTGCATSPTGPHVTEPASERPAAPAPKDPLRDRWTPIGMSESDRPILATSVGHGPVRILLIGSIHGDEAEARAAFAGMQRALRDPSVSSLATIRVIKDLNPDGSTLGTRANARGIDLNRNWPATNFRPSRTHGPRALSERETRAGHGEYRHFRPALVIVLHSARGGPFVNHDGPQPRTRSLADAFASGAQRVDGRWRVVDDMGYPTPGSLGSLVGLDDGVPILTVELRRRDPDGDRDRRAILAGLEAALRLLRQGR